MTASSLMRDKLYQRAAEIAERLGGEQVVSALQEASSAVWEAGIDEIVTSDELKKDPALADAFDIAWLAPFVIELRKRAGERGP